jgi:hypothetical protein
LGNRKGEGKGTFCNGERRFFYGFGTKRPIWLGNHQVFELEAKFVDKILIGGEAYRIVPRGWVIGHWQSWLSLQKKAKYHQGTHDHESLSLFKKIFTMLMIGLQVIADVFCSAFLMMKMVLSSKVCTK